MPAFAILTRTHMEGELLHVSETKQFVLLHALLEILYTGL